MMKRKNDKKLLDEEELRDWWLMKYHNTNSKEVVEKHPEEVKSPEWFKLYPVTQEQYDEWEAWAKDYVSKIIKLPKRNLRMTWGLVALQVGPCIKEEESDGYN